jgi:hypothetical protein
MSCWSWGDGERAITSPNPAAITSATSRRRFLISRPTIDLAPSCENRLTRQNRPTSDDWRTHLAQSIYGSDAAVRHSRTIEMQETTMPFRRAPRATAYDAIAYLASACDGARRRDGHGFNSEHVEIGHRLARATRWSRRDRRTATQLIRFYRRQLSTAGYDVDALLGRGAPKQKSRRHRRSSPAQWAPDPTGVHRWRYWNSRRWTELTSDSNEAPSSAQVKAALLSES